MKQEKTQLMVSPDGCPVEVYAALPPEPELSFVEKHIGPGSRILDLGCGAGRIAEPLARAGHHVVGVDESAEMLAELRDATPVHAAIAGLDLGQTFDVVLLMSYLMNIVDPLARAELLATCARHAAPAAAVLIQRHDPGQREIAGEAQIGPVHVTVKDVDDRAWPEIGVKTVYELPGRLWTQRWTARILDDEETKATLRAAGLEPIELSGKWVVAHPIASLPLRQAVRSES